MTERLQIQADGGNDVITTSIITDSETRVEYLVVITPNGISTTPLLSTSGTPKIKIN